MGADRYEGWADWYDGYVQDPAYGFVSDTLLDLVGPGDGRCLDYGCGVGHHHPGLSGLGWSVVGLDLSADMLRVARGRSPRLVQGDASRMPFPPASFDAVVSCLTHTDVDDVTPVFAEVQRVLPPGGRYVTVAVHPCFAGPTATRTDDGGVLVGAGYRDTSRRFVGQGVRARVGVRHVPLHELLTKLAGAGFCIDRVVEPEPLPVPLWLGISATRR